MASLTSALLARDPNYIYPLVVNVLTALLPIYPTVTVSSARAKTGLKYPHEYWPGNPDEKTDREKWLFNCTQRAHQVPCAGGWLTGESVGESAYLFYYLQYPFCDVSAFGGSYGACVDSQSCSFSLWV